MGDQFAVIMAGGSGTRFWPASRAARPKQFLALGGGEESLLQATVRRVQPLVGHERVIVVTSQRHASEVLDQLPDLPRENILFEPVGRNTAACLAWASAYVRRRDPDAVVAALPADHRIGEGDAFRGAAQRALNAAHAGSIVTLGIRPTSPETGYGYLEVGDRIDADLHRVRAFVEKPTRERAQQFLDAGKYLWNSGMFFFRADTLLREVGRSLPELAAFVTRCDDAAKSGQEADVIAHGYPALASISIDYGVMEKADNVLVVPGSFGWNDLGSWAASWELAPKDAADNAAAGALLAIDSRGCFASTAAGKLVVLVGLQDIVAVDTDDALLIMPRDRAQDVSKVVQALKAEGRDRLL
jgi:mannose-1-phosphate guanylyltransferase